MSFTHLQAVDAMKSLHDITAKPPVKAEWHLNRGQEAAADGFFQFLFEPQKELSISGPGGTGKTYLMSYLIDKVLPRYLDTCKLMGIAPEYDEVVMTATTNKAAEVLAQATGRPTATIHSFLGLTVRDDHKTGASLLTKTNAWTVHHRKIIFVDEGSMVDTPLLNHLREGTANCKIVFVSDHCQLAPVSETISPIYIQNPPLPFYELTEPMRTNNPHLQAINAQLRVTVETGVFRPIRVVPGVIDHLSGPEMQAAIDATFGELNNHSRILAYTNKQVAAYADYIRGDLRQLVQPYIVGEQLVSNSAVQINKTQRLSVEEEVEIVRLGDTEFVEVQTAGDGIDPVMLEIVRADLKSGHSRYTDVRLPVDRAHYTALVEFYRANKLWTKHFWLKGNFPDLKLRESGTVHKAQGSTYDTVFIDLDNLSTCHNPKMAARLLYVAFSRARHRIVLYGTLAAKYGGLIR